MNSPESVERDECHVPFTADGIRRGMRATVPMSVSVATYGIVFGMLARQVGVTLPENILMNVFVFAGAAQTAALDGWSYPLPVFSIVMTVLLINLRLLLIGASVRPWIGQLPPGRAYPLLHILADEGWAIAMNARRHGERDIGFFVGANLLVALAWLPAVIAGHLAGGQLGDPAAVGLDFAFTAVFAAMLFGGYRGRFDLVPWTVAAVSALLGSWLLPGTWYVLLGGIAGFAAGAWRGSPAALDVSPDDGRGGR